MTWSLTPRESVSHFLQKKPHFWYRIYACKRFGCCLYNKSWKITTYQRSRCFSSPWGTLLENNKEYVGRVKIQVYSPEREVISSTEWFTAKDNAEITDIYKDETGASATVYGRSQIPFEGSLVFSILTATSSELYGGLTTIPIIVRVGDILVIILAVFLLNLIAGIYLAQQVAKLDPVKAISSK